MSATPHAESVHREREALKATLEQGSFPPIATDLFTAYQEAYKKTSQSGRLNAIALVIALDYHINHVASEVKLSVGNLLDLLLGKIDPDFSLIRWHSPEELLPDDDTTVLVELDDGEQYIAYHCDGQWFYHDDNDIGLNVLRWTHLPSTPFEA